MRKTFSDHLSEERRGKLNRAWAYLKPHQRAWIYIRTLWWALPSLYELITAIKKQFMVKLLYWLYQAHWIEREWK